MRLTSHEIYNINSAFYDVFKEGRVYLFGSRVDDTKRGGDIDLYIILEHKADTKGVADKKSRFLLQLYDTLGEQKIDVVISKDKNRPIEKEAIRSGILLNTNQLKVKKYLDECDKHLQRVKSAYDDIKHIFPLSSKKYQSLNDEEIKTIDQYLFRFSKLQDTIGEKLFRLIVQEFVEDSHKLSFLDLLNQLEKVEILDNANDWKNLRDARNNISHQYDDEPDDMADALNKFFAQKDVLVQIYSKIKLFYANKLKL